MNREGSLDADDDPFAGEEGSYALARFPVDLHLPVAAGSQLQMAARAIRREFREAAKWKRLQCRKVMQVSESPTGTIYELEIRHAVEFDWTWEGAVAFRPLLLKEFEDSEATFFENGYHDPDIEDSILWSGEVLEVDPASGRIFIVVSDPEHPPQQGSFYVRPFQFLAFLDSVFNEPAFQLIQHQLSTRLAATAGDIHPAMLDLPSSESSIAAGLPELRSWWNKTWSVLWGPPGTGKTYTTGQQVARVIADSTANTKDRERILVVSTTNKATDAVALSIGKAAKQLEHDFKTSPIRRIGKGSSLRKFEDEDLIELLRGTETEFLSKIESLATEIAKTRDPRVKAMLRHQSRAVRQSMRDAALRNFLDADVQVVVCTSFRALSFLHRCEIKENLELGFAPFTTVLIDEAGLISRSATAALSLLASRRVSLIGDSKQLAPISRISRILEPAQGEWLARSGLSHLDRLRQRSDGVHILQQQRRMHPEICNVVSNFQYDGFLATAPETAARKTTLPHTLQDQPRAIWYVLDDDTNDLASIRAERGVGNRSWIRTATIKVLQKLFSDPTMHAAKGLFISPFSAQTKEIHSFFAEHDLENWTASTVHSQQGSEADVVIFDTVNAGSYGWAYDDWKRLVNVALSRSRESVVLLASRAEMAEPYLRPLLTDIVPQVLKWRSNQWTWERVPQSTNAAKEVHSEDRAAVELLETAAPYQLGSQFAKRKSLQPILSNEQQRLCSLELDGKPRLVRGVAGSGKTAVLAHWLTQTLQRLSTQSNLRIWAVFANRALQSLIGDSIANAWESQTGQRSFPWDRVELHHIREILEVMLPEVGLSASSFQFDYDKAAEAYLQRKHPSQITARCDALFIDEAQDMGPHTLKLLSSLVRQTDASDENSRSVNIFYDNAQNVYGRSTPKWSDLGLDMRGRSTVMKESFRSTQPIIEFALNVFYQLVSPESNPDHREFVRRGLIELTNRQEMDWWRVHFNQIDGPKPGYYQSASIEEECAAIGDYCRQLIAHQSVQPNDICLIYTGKNVPQMLQEHMLPRLDGLGIDFSVQTNKPFAKSNRTLLATTPHSYKGHEAEVVIIPCVDQYRAEGKGILANGLYVAMTRARSVLTIFSRRRTNLEAVKIHNTISRCLHCLTDAPPVDFSGS